MKFLRCAEKQGALFTGSLVTHGYNQVEVLAGELVPGFAARLPCIYAVLPEGFNGSRVHKSRRRTAGAHGLISPHAEMIDQGFGHNGATGIAGAKNKDTFHADGLPVFNFILVRFAAALGFKNQTI